MRVSVNIQRGAYKRLDEDLRVPDNGMRFIRCKTWEELGKGDNAKAYPQVITPSNAGLLTKDPNGVKYDYVELPDEALWLIWKFCRWSGQKLLPHGKIESFYTRPGNERTFANFTPGSVMYVYGDTMEAHRWATEAGSAEGGFRDPVTGRNMDFPQNILYLLRPTGGFLGRVLATVGAYHHIEAIDLLKTLPPFEEIIQKPWLWFWATQSDKFNGSTRFPQVKNANGVWGLPPAGLALPLFSLGGEIWLPKTSCVDLIPGAKWTPYVP